MKKLFGGINLTWKKLIIFAIIAGVYTAIMALLPITKDTSFRDIAIYLEWWILFGIIIISNSKSAVDSALKCFIFFLISQPLVYLIQVPFSELGFGLFNYYKPWFMWTLACLPMGFIGYYINKKNWISVVILFPMLVFLAYIGLGYLTSVVDRFPYHLLSCISCFAMIIIVVLNLFDKTKHKVVSLVGVILLMIAYIVLKGGLFAKEYETYKALSEYNLNLSGEVYVSTFTGTAKGRVDVINSEEGNYSVKLNCLERGNYTFELTDETGNIYSFEYHYDKDLKSVVLNKVE